MKIEKTIHLQILKNRSNLTLHKRRGNRKYYPNNINNNDDDNNNNNNNMYYNLPSAVFFAVIRPLRCHDSDDNENIKKAIG